MSVPTPDAACDAASRAGAPLLDPDRALAMVLEQTPVGRTEVRRLANALGLVLAEEVTASVDQPPFSRALMDGFAVCLADAGRAVTLAGEIAAGQRAASALRPGTAAEIMTGAPCPAGSEAVVRVEDAMREAQEVRLPAAIAAGQHIQPVGALCRRGHRVLAKGDRLGPMAIAAATAAGRERVPVLAPPSLAILTTGDELLRGGPTTRAASIIDSNGPMLVAMAKRLGVEQLSLDHADDDEALLAAAIERAAGADVLVLSGGVSMGRRDLVPGVLSRLGARLVFHRVRQQPGKPLLFARRGEQLVFGLPGTPLGSHLGFHRYVGAAIRKWSGLATELPRYRGTLSAPLRTASDRVLYRLVRVTRHRDGWQIAPLRWLGSSDVIGPALANAYCRFEPGAHELDAGTELSWEPLQANVLDE